MEYLLLLLLLLTFTFIDADYTRKFATIANADGAANDARNKRITLI